MHTVVGLLRELAATPDLPGAACAEPTARDVFDAATDKRARTAYAKAIRICAGCTQLRACRRWLLSLPPAQRPPGVTAGLIRRSR
jgi:hypothetical protein